jgi:serine/threonine protein kinase
VQLIIELKNILLTKSVGVKLCDFGFATIAFDGAVKKCFASFESSALEVLTGRRCNGCTTNIW